MSTPSRLAADLMLIQSYTRQIGALCTAALECLDDADAAERQEWQRLAELVGQLGGQVEALRRRYPPAATGPGFPLFV